MQLATFTKQGQKKLLAKMPPLLKATVLPVGHLVVCCPSLLVP